MSTLLLVPLDDTVVFPNISVSLTIDVGDDERVLLVPRHDGEFAEVGTVAEVTGKVRRPGGGVRRISHTHEPGMTVSDRRTTPRRVRHGWGRITFVANDLRPMIARCR